MTAIRPLSVFLPFPISTSFLHHITTLFLYMFLLQYQASSLSIHSLYLYPKFLPLLCISANAVARILVSWSLIYMLVSFFYPAFIPSPQNLYTCSLLHLQHHFHALLLQSFTPFGCAFAFPQSWHCAPTFTPSQMRSLIHFHSRKPEVIALIGNQRAKNRSQRQRTLPDVW